MTSGVVIVWIIATAVGLGVAVSDLIDGLADKRLADALAPDDARRRVARRNVRAQSVRAFVLATWVVVGVAAAVQGPRGLIVYGLLIAAMAVALDAIADRRHRRAMLTGFASEIAHREDEA